MPRNSERSFCCGAGGARMWMEENTGERINLNRTNEAVETGADQIATGCPFCRVMLSDGLTAKQADGSAREEVEVLDVAQLLLASVKREKPGTDGKKEPAAEPVETKAEPGPADVTRDRGDPHRAGGGRPRRPGRRPGRRGVESEPPRRPSPRPRPTPAPGA